MTTTENKNSAPEFPVRKDPNALSLEDHATLADWKREQAELRTQEPVLPEVRVEDINPQPQVGSELPPISWKAP